MADEWKIERIPYQQKGEDPAAYDAKTAALLNQYAEAGFKLFRVVEARGARQVWFVRPARDAAKDIANALDAVRCAIEGHP